MSQSRFIEVPNALPCAFCEYIARRRPYTVLRQTRLTIALVTREQRGAGHTLVMPVRHVPTILDLAASEGAALMREIRAIAQAIDESERRPGIAIWQNNGVPAEQTIPHVHFHVAGTLPEGGTQRGSVKELGIRQTDAIAARLQSHLRADSRTRGFD